MKRSKKRKHIYVRQVAIGHPGVVDCEMPPFDSLSYAETLADKDWGKGWGGFLQLRILPLEITLGWRVNPSMTVGVCAAKAGHDEAFHPPYHIEILVLPGINAANEDELMEQRYHGDNVSLRPIRPAMVLMFDRERCNEALKRPAYDGPSRIVNQMDRESQPIMRLSLELAQYGLLKILEHHKKETQ